MSLFKKVISCSQLSIYEGKLDLEELYAQFEDYYGTDVADSFKGLCKEHFVSVDDLYKECLKIVGENLEPTENTGWELDDTDLCDADYICYDIFPDILIATLILLRHLSPAKEYNASGWIHYLTHNEIINFNLSQSTFSRNINNVPPLLQEFLGIQKKKNAFSICTHYPNLLAALISNANKSPFAKSKDSSVSFANDLSFLSVCTNIISHAKNDLDIEQYYILERLFSINSQLDFFRLCITNRGMNVNYPLSNVHYLTASDVYYLPVVSQKSTWFKTISHLGVNDTLDYKTSKDIMHLLTTYAFPLTLGLFYSYLVTKYNYYYDEIKHRIKSSRLWEESDWNFVLKATKDEYSLVEKCFIPSRAQKELYSGLFKPLDFDISGILNKSYKYNQFD